MSTPKPDIFFRGYVRSSEVIEFSRRLLPSTPIDSPWLPPKLPPTFAETIIALGPIRGVATYLRLSANLRRPQRLATSHLCGRRRGSVSPGTIGGKSREVALRLISRGRLTARCWESSSRSTESDFLRHAPGTPCLCEAQRARDDTTAGAWLCPPGHELIWSKARGSAETPTQRLAFRGLARPVGSAAQRAISNSGSVCLNLNLSAMYRAEFSMYGNTVLSLIFMRSSSRSIPDFSLTVMRFT